MAKRRTSSKKKKKIESIAAAIVVIAALFITVAPKLGIPVPSWNDIFASAELTNTADAAKQPFSAHYIDVGQGDCILIKSDDRNVLIDAGERGNADKIIRYLKQYDVTKLDYVIATHPHSDHIGSMAEVISAFPVSNVIMPKLSKSNTPTTKTYENLLKAVQKTGAKVIPAVPSESYEIGGADMTVLAPLSDKDDINNMSVVVRVVYGDNSFLFTGDAEEESENRILKSGASVRSDVMKGGHHGSRTSSSEKYMDAVSPSLYIVSCGKDNDYGHPHKETVDMLEKRKISYLRTDEAGSIVVGSDGKKLSVSTEKGAVANE